MAIPDYQTVMLPLLKFAADSHEHSLRDAIDTLVVVTINFITYLE